MIDIEIIWSKEIQLESQLKRVQLYETSDAQKTEWRDLHLTEIGCAAVSRQAVNRSTSYSNE